MHDMKMTISSVNVGETCRPGGEVMYQFLDAWTSSAIESIYYI